MQTAWLDTLRVLAVGAVIVVHAASGTVVFSELGTTDWWAANVLDSLARWCVPVFVMISGGLLLNPKKHEGARTFYAKRLSRVLIPLVFWSAFYIGWAALRATVRAEPLEAADLLSRLMSGRPHYHMWYLYMLLPLYLITPGLQRMTATLSRRSLTVVTAALFAAASTYAAFRYANDVAASHFLFWFIPYVPYAVAGHLLLTSERPVHRVLTAIVFGLAVAGTAAGCYVLASADDIYGGLYAYDYLSITVIPMSIAVFLLAKGWTLAAISADASARLAALTLGIYLIHPIFLGPISSLQEAYIEMPALLAVPLVSALAFVLSGVTALAIQHVPGVRRII